MDKESDSTFEIDNSSSPEFFDDEYKDIEEIKLYIIGDKRGKKSSSKALVIKPVEYTNVMEKINAVVQKPFQNENIKLSDYSMSYKAMNAHGPSSELEDKCDFDEFIEDYKKVIAANKKMAVTIELEDSTNEKVKKTEKRSKVSDESELSTSEEGNMSSYSKKKKKSRVLREDDLSKEEKTRAEVISALSKKYEYDIHSTPCYVQDNRHLQFNPARLQIWAREIINKNTTEEIPPNFPTFNIVLGKKNTQDKQTAAMTFSNTPIIIQMPPFQYPYSNFNHSDQKHKCDTYSKLVNNFVEEEITVDLIKDLSNKEMEKLGITKIGWKKNVRQAAQKY
ncbi:hypothetical protein RhiirA4_543786 [Rhizophagus irregularis]|uniref:SAM domain-containing protein n=1 Tax=Rhizophagus irregularis TaxID=588596 RepID=A0A2I1GKQ0_9GLOM|nr:hypothetical protein RhiirA4_543786 [Rhizophagus irregularis]